MSEFWKKAKEILGDIMGMNVGIVTGETLETDRAANYQENARGKVHVVYADFTQLAFDTIHDMFMLTEKNAAQRYIRKDENDNRFL